jgi:hypothetical protein
VQLAGVYQSIKTRAVEEVIRQALIQACYNLLLPVARFVLRRGMTFSEFATVAKLAFVHVGTRDFGVEGKDASVSRVARLTGMSRRDIERHLSADEALGRVRLIQRSVVSTGQEPDAIRLFGLRLGDLGATMDYNASRQADRVHNFEGTAYSLRLSSRDLALFRRLVSSHGIRFLEQMDSWLGSHEPQDDRSASGPAAAGVGVYLFAESAYEPDARGTRPVESAPAD